MCTDDKQRDINFLKITFYYVLIVLWAERIFVSDPFGVHLFSNFFLKVFHVELTYSLTSFTFSNKNETVSPLIKKRSVLALGNQSRTVDATSLGQHIGCYCCSNGCRTHYSTLLVHLWTTF